MDRARVCTARPSCAPEPDASGTKDLIRFLLRRLLWFAITLTVVVSVSFVLMRMVKGGPFDGERSLHPAIERNIKARYHLDWPIVKQFVQYVGPLNLDRQGLRILSAKDRTRRIERVRLANGERAIEGVPRPIPHLEEFDSTERARLDQLAAHIASGAPTETESPSAQLARAQAPFADLPAGRSPVLAPLFDELYATHEARDAPAVERLSVALEALTGHTPTPATGLPQSPSDALVRHWFGWYYRHAGQTLWNTGKKPFTGILTGDFGPSFRYRDYTVNQIIAESLPISVRLGLLALMWALALGLSAGFASALRRGSGLDLAMRLVATTGIALPNFVIAGFLIICFVFLIPLLPVAGWDSIRHMLLPSFALGAPFAAYIARLTRTGMLESLSQDHIRTAHAKGLSAPMVVLRHALKGGILPVVSYLGPATAGILTGSLVIERIFFIPGTGSHFINSALSRDYTLAMGVTILYTVLVYSLNTIVDLAYTFLDPRISLEDE